MWIVKDNELCGFSTAFSQCNSSGKFRLVILCPFTVPLHPSSFRAKTHAEGLSEVLQVEIIQAKECSTPDLSFMFLFLYLYLELLIGVV